MSSEIAIRAENLSKSYRIYDRPQDRLIQMVTAGRIRRFREFHALNNISFEVERGESVGIVGTNGSGKSTLLQIICGTVTPTTGTVDVRGRLSALLELGAGFNPEFSGIENVFLNGAILGLSEEQMQNKLDSILAFADIGEFVYQPVKTYSSGMFVRLAFAVAVNVEPDILIVDEALAVGDNLFQKRCFAKIEELLAKDATLLFVSHDQESVRTLTKRALLLDKGTTLYFGPSAGALLAYRKLLHEKETEYLRKYEPDKPLPPPLETPQETPPVEAAPVVEEAPVSEPTPPVIEVIQVEETSPPPGNLEHSRSRDLSFGDGDAKVLAVRILDSAGNICHSFNPLDELVIQMDIQTFSELTNLNVGVRIRNKQGIKVYSWGTLNQDISIWSGKAEGEVFWDKVFPAGSRFTVELRSVCGLGTGFYEIQSYVAHDRDRFFGQQRILDWCDEAAFFTVIVVQTEYFFGGICDMQMVSKFIEG